MRRFHHTDERTDTMAKLRTKADFRTALAIHDREPFETHGALRGIAGKGDTGRLDKAEFDAFHRDYADIDYSVYSYETPIAWHTRDNRWHKVAQRFSVTTSMHQGNLYLIDAPASVVEGVRSR
jgi:hypothetical protein